MAKAGNTTASLYVGNLDARVCSELLEQLFSLAGSVLRAKVVGDPATGASLGFGFVDYSVRADAARAITKFTGRTMYGLEIRVEWAHTAGNSGAILPGASASGIRTGALTAGPGGPTGLLNGTGVPEDLTTHYCLFVGNISPEVDDSILAAGFIKFGTSCSSAKVARDNDTGRAGGYGFVTYREKVDAQTAIESMNGTVVGSKPLRVDWARTKNGGRSGDNPQGRPGGSTGVLLDYATVVNQTPPINVTVYLAGLPVEVEDSLLRGPMEKFGTIEEIKIPEASKLGGIDRAYAFVKYATHEEAARAIVDMQGADILGRRVTAQWGRESARRAMSIPPALTPGQPLPFPQAQSMAAFQGPRPGLGRLT